jgi:hypothetical protein
MRTSPSNAIAPVASVLSVVLAGCILPYFERSEDGSEMGGGNAIATTVTSGKRGNPIVTTATRADGGNSLATTSTGEGGGTTTSATASTSGAGGSDSELVAIQGGTFTLGDLGTSATVADLELDRTEVTVDAYAACVDAGSCAATQTGGNCNAGVPGRGSHPIHCVDRIRPPRTARPFRNDCPRRLSGNGRRAGRLRLRCIPGATRSRGLALAGTAPATTSARGTGRAPAPWGATRVAMPPAASRTSRAMFGSGRRLLIRARIEQSEAAAGSTRTRSTSKPPMASVTRQPTETAISASAAPADRRPTFHTNIA